MKRLSCMSTPERKAREQQERDNAPVFYENPLAASEYKINDPGLAENVRQAFDPEIFTKFFDEPPKGKSTFNPEDSLGIEYTLTNYDSSRNNAPDSLGIEYTLTNNESSRNDAPESRDNSDEESECSDNEESNTSEDPYHYEYSKARYDNPNDAGDSNDEEDEYRTPSPLSSGSSASDDEPPPLLGASDDEAPVDHQIH